MHVHDSKSLTTPIYYGVFSLCEHFHRWNHSRSICFCDLLPQATHNALVLPLPTFQRKAMTTFLSNIETRKTHFFSACRIRVLSVMPDGSCVLRCFQYLITRAVTHIHVVETHFKYVQSCKRYRVSWLYNSFLWIQDFSICMQTLIRIYLKHDQRIPLKQHSLKQKIKTVTEWWKHMLQKVKLLCWYLEWHFRFLPYCSGGCPRPDKDHVCFIEEYP